MSWLSCWTPHTISPLVPLWLFCASSTSCLKIERQSATDESSSLPVISRTEVTKTWYRGTFTWGEIYAEEDGAWGKGKIWRTVCLRGHLVRASIWDSSLFKFDFITPLKNWSYWTCSFHCLSTKTTVLCLKNSNRLFLYTRYWNEASLQVTLMTDPFQIISHFLSLHCSLIPRIWH